MIFQIGRFGIHQGNIKSCYPIEKPQAQEIGSDERPAGTQWRVGKRGCFALLQHLQGSCLGVRLSFAPHVCFIQITVMQQRAGQASGNTFKYYPLAGTHQ